MIQMQQDLRYITTVATGMDAVVVIDQTQNILLFNSYAERLFGYKEDEVLGKPLDILLPKESIEKHRHHINNFIKSGNIGQPMAERQIFQGRHAKGYKIEFEASISQTKYNGKLYCTAVLRDVSPFRQKELFFRKSEQTLKADISRHRLELEATHSKLSEVQRLSQIGLWELNLESNTLHWSTEVFDIFELDRNKFSASYEAFLAAIHPEDRDMVNQIYVDSVANKRPYQVRHRLLMKDGRTKYVEERCETFYGNYGEPIRSVGTIQDITSQVILDQQRLQLQTLLLRVESLAEIGSWEWDPNDNRMYWSPEMYRQYGLSPDSIPEPSYQLAMEFIHPEDRKRVEEKNQNIPEIGSPIPLEYRIIDTNGTIRHMRSLCERLKDKPGNKDRMYGFVQDISRYKDTEQKIVESNQLLEAVFNAAKVAIAYLDTDFNFIRVNKAYANTDSKDPDYFTGKNHFDLYPNEENEKIFRKSVITGEAVEFNAKPFEYAANPERGISHWDWTLTPIKNSEGNVTALVLSLLEVTDRIQAIEALKENEDKLKVLNETLELQVERRTTELRDERNFINTVLKIQGALVIVLDHFGNIIMFNRACEETTGFSFSELNGKPVWKYLISPDERQAVEQVFHNLTMTAIPSRYENHWLTKNGDLKLIDWSNSTITDQDGNVRYVIATGIDISERRKIEEKLRKSESGLLQAQRIAKMGSWEMDEKSGKIWWSKENYHIFGRDPEHYQPSLQDYFNAVHPDDVKAVEQAAENLRATGFKDIIHRITLPDGEEKIVHEMAEAKFDDNGELLLTRGTVHDITELKQSENERHQLQRQLQQAQKMESIGHLTGGIAHDFNNILSAILGFTRLAKTRFAPNSEGALGNYLTEIEKAGERASGLVKQMLAFSRGNSQDHIIFDPGPIILETVKMLRSTIPASIEISHKFHDKDLFIQSDALELQQALVNLIINSRDALDGKGSIELSLNSINIPKQECTSCHKMFSGKFVLISVSDTGSGITPDIIPRIFDPFFTTKMPGQGSGMGLALIHGFVHSSGGHIRVDSDKAGSVFTMVFPHRQSATSDSLPGKIKSDITAINNSQSSYKILLVDDEKPVVKLLTEILELENYQVVSTTSSNKALQFVKDSPDIYDLLITDQTMPELTGLELIAEVRKLRSDIPTILCSGYNKETYKLDINNRERIHFVAKPVEQNKLIQLVADLVGNNNTTKPAINPNK